MADKDHIDWSWIRLARKRQGSPLWNSVFGNSILPPCSDHWETSSVSASENLWDISMYSRKHRDYTEFSNQSWHNQVRYSLQGLGSCWLWSTRTYGYKKRRCITLQMLVFFDDIFAFCPWQRTKHIDIRTHFIDEVKENDCLKVKFIPSEEILQRLQWETVQRHTRVHVVNMGETLIQVHWIAGGRMLRRRNFWRKHASQMDVNTFSSNQSCSWKKKHFGKIQ